MKKNTTYLIIILLCSLYSIGPSLVFSQNFENAEEAAYHEKALDPNAINESEWKKATKDKDYGKIELVKKEVKAAQEDKEKKAFDLNGKKWWVLLIKILSVITVIGLGIMIAIGFENGFFFSTRGKKINTTDFDIDSIEENLEAVDLDQLIVQAEREENYKIAVRLFYLNLIKSLSEQHIITYKKNKTNHSYFAKVDTTTFGNDFRQATQFFERIWFGQSLFTKLDYRFVKPQFEKWLKNVRQLTHKSLNDAK